MKLKLVNLFSFSINVLLSFSFLPQKGSLMKTFFRSSKRKFGIKLSSCDESFRKLLIVCDCMFFVPAFSQDNLTIYQNPFITTVEGRAQTAKFLSSLCRFPFML